jgi:hypothetical protein
MILHWDQEIMLELEKSFDVIVASDWYASLSFCTSFLKFIIYVFKSFLHFFLLGKGKEVMQ